MKKLLREPLLHFLLAGALLFGIFALLNDAPAPRANSIVVDADRIQQLRQAWQKQWQRPATPKELRGLVDQHIREEVLYREALSLGLEKEDTIVRRRLAQKMKFLIQDLSDRVQPDGAQLAKFFQENKDKFKLPPRISFSHLYFNPDKQGASAVDRARLALEKFKSGQDQEARSGADSFMLNSDYLQISPQEASRLFGQRFAGQLFKHRPGPWQGPLRSGYGLHLVLIKDYSAGRLPGLEQIEDKVRQEYLDQQRRRANREAIEALKKRYRIEVDEQALASKGPEEAS